MKQRKKVLIIATTNDGKVKEFKKLLDLSSIELLSLADLNIKQKPEEKGKTFIENAVVKCVFYSRLTDFPILAEDSGLCVDYLDGAPGIHSARFSGKNATDQTNNELLLKKLAGIPFEKRSAHYQAVTVIGYRGKIIGVGSGKMFGYITEQSHGSGGFGYDPLFYLSEHNKTAAELPIDEKNKISHRAKAVRQLVFTINYL